MLKDITLGQYFPMESIVHKLDARFKLCLTFVFIIMLFASKTIVGLSVGFVYMAMVLLLSKIPPIMLIKAIKPVVPVLIFTALLNLLFLHQGEDVFRWKFIQITDYGIQMSAFMLVRIILLIMGTSLLTYTTSPIVLTDAIERLLSPLKRIKFPVHELAMMMTIALRFVPTLIEETDKIMSAQKSRGASFDTGNLMNRVRALIPIMLPLFISAFRRADELATAMECRLYHGGEGRTRLKVLKSAMRDYVAVVISLVFLAGVYVMNAYA
jgi:energy-coupling factor transport system permease protein